jgi:raffinose/stachyose/melibiose transport system substrate-binding protein
LVLLGIIGLRPEELFSGITELSRSRGMMNPPRLVALFLGVALLDTARSFILPFKQRPFSKVGGLWSAVDGSLCTADALRPFPLSGIMAIGDRTGEEVLFFLGRYWGIFPERYSARKGRKEFSMKKNIFYGLVFLGWISLACSALAIPGAAGKPSLTPPPSSTPMPSSTPLPSLTPEPTATSRKVNLTWWHIATAEADRALYQKFADDYTAAHPGVTIEITVADTANFKTNLTSAMNAENPPDIFHSYVDMSMQAYAKAGLLKNITADLDQAGWRETFWPVALDLYAYQGNNYGVPRDMGIVGIWYNKDLFQRAGIVEFPATWADFLNDVKKLEASGITPIALGAADSWTCAFWWEYLALRLGGKAAFDAAVRREGSFADPPFVEAGRQTVKLVNLSPFQNGYLSAGYNNQAAAVGNGKAAMELMGYWGGRVEGDNSANRVGIGDKLGWFPFPAVEGGAGDPADALGGLDGWLVGKNAPPEAVDFLKYISSVESETAQARQGLTLPAVKGAEAGVTDPLLKIVWQHTSTTKYLQIYYDQFLGSAVGDVINSSMLGLFAGRLTPEQTAQAIEDSAEQEIP